MKKYILILFAAASLVWSCAELENDSRVASPTAPTGLSNVATSSRIGSVVFTWDNPTSGDYYYTLVEFERGGQTVTHKISRYAVSPTLGEGHTRYIYEGFDDTNTYTFTLTPYSVDGQAGPSTTVKGSAEDASYAYKYVAETATIEPEVQGAKVSWVNEYHRECTIVVTYKDVTGATKTVKKTSAEDGSLSIGAFTDATEVTVVTTNGTASSDPIKLTVTPKTGEIPASRMSVKEYSDYWQAGTEVEKVLDRNTNTYWHTNLNGPYHWFTINLGGLHKVNAVEVIRRQSDAGYGSPLRHVKVSVSKDNSSWTVVHDDDYDATYVYATHLWIFDEQICQYVKVEVTSEGSWAHVAEFLAYYSANPAGASPYADLASAELAPDPDEDDTVYDDVEYLRPRLDVAGWLNNVKAYQTDDRSNDTEWTYETTGGDSWLPLVDLQADAKGPQMVFIYKSSAAIMCEFFWCPGGFGVGGPAGGKETQFNLAKTSDWKVFKKDFSSDFSKWGFGKKGDTVRFDIGNGAGVKVIVKNMRWQPLPE